ncbi:MAG TPA: hypothetical protein VGK15_02080 [Candidatus Limnocylindria bacterium]
MYYLIAVAPGSVPFVFVAVAHFIIGYVWGRGVMARPMTMPLAITGTLMAGAFTRLALGTGTNEISFVWIGPLAAAALSDVSTPRGFLYSGAAFALGYVALLWLAP